MENEDKKYEAKYSQSAVAAMIPDYIFNRLSEEERAEFEIAILNYPELEQELKEGKELFARVEALDYKKLLKDKSQYLPDRVVARLERKNALYSEQKPNIRRLVLILGFAAALIIYVGIQNDFSFSNFFGSNKENATPMVCNDSSPQTIIASETKQSIAYLQHSEKFWTELEKKYIAENFDEYDLFEYISSCADWNYLLLLDKIENMDEKSFQEFLNAIRK